MYIFAAYAICKIYANLYNMPYSYLYASGYILKKEMAAHSTILAWEIPGMEEPGGLQIMRSHSGRD